MGSNFKGAYIVKWMKFRLMHTNLLDEVDNDRDDILGVGGDGIAGLTPELRLVLTLAMVKDRSVGR
jgi:hypothetical protein